MGPGGGGGLVIVFGDEITDLINYHSLYSVQERYMHFSRMSGMSLSHPKSSSKFFAVLPLLMLVSTITKSSSFVSTHALFPQLFLISRYGTFCLLAETMTHPLFKI